MGKYNTDNKKLNVHDFQHPLDKAAVDAIVAIPGFTKLLNYISEHSVERVYGFINNSSRLKLTEEMSPLIYSMISEAGEMFQIEETPNTYLERSYEYKITLEGIKNPYIIFTTSFLEGVGKEMLWPVVASEFAGIQAKHAMIKFIDLILRNARGVLPFGIDMALEFAMNNWYRNKAYTYDRAVLLASEDFELTARYILLGEASDEVLESIGLGQSGNPYMEQTNEFLERRGIDGIYQKFSTAFTRSQWEASRYAELYNWYQSGEYHEVLERSVT